MLLLEAEDEMKSKRISEIQNFLAEKMQEAEGKCFESQTGECFFFLQSVSGRRLPKNFGYHILQITVFASDHMYIDSYLLRFLLYLFLTAKLDIV